MRFFYLLITILIILGSCKNNKENYVPLSTNSSVKKAVVKEVIQGGSYTFLLVNEKNKDYWMAVDKTDTEVDEVIYYDNALLMSNFKSKELDRIFEEILFVENISDSPQLKKSMPTDSVHKTRKESEPKEIINVDPAPGGVTIGELYKNRNDYEGKKVMVRGQVVKINKNIMDRNWIHLRDGTSDEGKSDLTFTSSAKPNVGDVIILEGHVALNKEFGAGYVYPLIVEDAIQK